MPATIALPWAAITASNSQIQTMPIVHLPRPIVNQILAHVQRDEEREVCGLISSLNGKPHQCYEINNIAANPATHFKMDPGEQIDTMREIREAGAQLYAIYHSHPHGPAKPSAIDLKEAGYPDAVYLIISLDTTGILEMRGFQIKQEIATEVALVIA